MVSRPPTGYPSKIPYCLALFLLGVWEGNLSHEALTREQLTDLLFQTKLLRHNNPNQQKKRGVDKAVNKSCCWLILYIDIYVVHCLGLMPLK